MQRGSVRPRSLAVDFSERETSETLLGDDDDGDEDER